MSYLQGLSLFNHFLTKSFYYQRLAMGSRINFLWGLWEKSLLVNKDWAVRAKITKTVQELICAQECVKFHSHTPYSLVKCKFQYLESYLQYRLFSIESTWKEIRLKLISVSWTNLIEFLIKFSFQTLYIRC